MYYLCQSSDATTMDRGAIPATTLSGTISYNSTSPNIASTSQVDRRPVNNNANDIDPPAEHEGIVSNYS